ncbi:MAG: DUF106 domain-containing protein [Candidatus Aenigmarchaeota archaeon]|nr:DUF106 domain-containing protein [Candidatus Aenigmarchaeota archaeon]
MVLEFIFGFLLNYPPAFSVFIFSIIILFVINIFYKILINQNDAKATKERTKEISKEMKEAQKAGDKDKSKRLMGELMSQNSKMMRMTMKPMIVSLIVVIVLLPSLATFYGDKIVALTDSRGSVDLHGTTYQVEKMNGTVKVGDASCSAPCTLEVANSNYKVTQEGNGLKIAEVVAVTPFALPYFGSAFGWLGWYIICSIPLVIIMRKAMKIYM